MLPVRFGQRCTLTNCKRKTWFEHISTTGSETIIPVAVDGLTTTSALICIASRPLVDCYCAPADRLRLLRGMRRLQASLQRRLLSHLRHCCPRNVNAFATAVDRDDSM